jgi:hypothetical protein
MVESWGDGESGMRIEPQWRLGKREKTRITLVVDGPRVIGKQEQTHVDTYWWSSFPGGILLECGTGSDCNTVLVSVGESTLVWNPLAEDFARRTDSISQRRGQRHFQVGSRSKTHMMVDSAENSITVFEPVGGEKWHGFEKLIGNIYPLIVPLDGYLLSVMEVAAKLRSHRKPVLSIRHGKPDMAFGGIYEPVAASD